MLKEEIQTFNSIQILGKPRWLTSEERRDGKLYSSITFAVRTEEERKRILRIRLLVAGISAQTAAFREFSPNSQCSKCQKFGHISLNCTSTPVCKFCAENHHTRDHYCIPCQRVGRKCGHMKEKCANCEEEHSADSLKCDYNRVRRRIPLSQQEIENLAG